LGGTPGLAGANALALFDEQAAWLVDRARADALEP
jgi:hypothetical protein